MTSTTMPNLKNRMHIYKSVVDDEEEDEGDGDGGYDDKIAASIYVLTTGNNLIALIL